MLPDTLAWPLLVRLLAVASMTLGNLAAYWQTDPRHLLGWSTVSQVSYLLVPVSVAGHSDLTLPSLLFYLAGYTVTNLSAFAVATALSERRGLASYQPKSSQETGAVSARSQDGARASRCLARLRAVIRTEITQQSHGSFTQAKHDRHRQPDSTPNPGDAISVERMIEMTVRTVAQVAAGFLAGAVLVGAPTWAVANQDDVAPSTQTGMSQMMSDAQSHDQMMTSMSEMMKDPAMRKEMASMMSEAMDQMPGMGTDGSDQGMSGMGRMHGMGAGNASSGAPTP